MLPWFQCINTAYYKPTVEYVKLFNLILLVTILTPADSRGWVITNLIVTRFLYAIKMYIGEESWYRKDGKHEPTKDRKWDNIMTISANSLRFVLDRHLSDFKHRPCFKVLTLASVIIVAQNSNLSHFACFNNCKKMVQTIFNIHTLINMY